MGVGMWFAHPVDAMINTATLLTWGAVSCLAMLIACMRSVRSVRRLGLRSAFRCRVWFELGGLSWHAAFLVCVVAATSSFLGEAWKVEPVETIAWSAGKLTVASLEE